MFKVGDTIVRITDENIISKVVLIDDNGYHLELLNDLTFYRKGYLYMNSHVTMESKYKLIKPKVNIVEILEEKDYYAWLANRT